ncbi:19563_t:CDS:2, partial [Funneliformis geosporum]
LNEPNIIEILQKAVHEVFSNCFSYQTKKERILINSLKRKSEELEKIDNKMGSIICGIRLEESLYNANCNVKQLKTKITKLQESGSNLSGEINLKQNFEEIRMSELISYKCKAKERIRTNAFYPSFAKLISDFDTIIKCQGCSAFRKKTATGFCSLCLFYILMDWGECLLNKSYIVSNKRNFLDLKGIILLASKQIFGFDQLQEGQLETVETYLSGKDTLVLIKTGGGKTFCYIVYALLFEGITIVISSLKALMKDQK